MPDGMSNFSEALCLADRLPNGTDVFVALFTTAADEDGENGIEAVGGGYARIGHQAWVNDELELIEQKLTRRKNVGLIQFAALTDVLTANGWAIFDAVSAGNLLFFGSFAAPEVFGIGDNPGWVDGGMRLRLGSPKASAAVSVLTIQEPDPVTTTDATPTQLASIKTLVDGEAVHIRATITGIDTVSNPNQHYFREVFISFRRDDLGLGSQVTEIRSETPDADTRVGFTTAEATLQLATDEIEIEAVGEVGPPILWKTRIEVLND